MNQPIISNNSSTIVTQNHSAGTITISGGSITSGIAMGYGATATSYGYCVNSSTNSFNGEWMLVSENQKSAIKLQQYMQQHPQLKDKLTYNQCKSLIKLQD